MNERRNDSLDEDVTVQAVGGRGTNDSNSSDTLSKDDCTGGKRRNDDIGSIVDISEQYRIMAQMEANIRVKDNTGFDMVEYKEQRRLLEKQRQEEQLQTQGRGRYHTKPKPKLPDVQHSGFVGDFSDNDGSHPSSGQSRPEEPPLPFTRANRRYIQNRRNNNSNRVRVSEICTGVVVPKNSHAAAEISSSTEHIVKCWGCSSISEIYLRVNTLATLVQCPECSTISPVM